MSTFKSDYYLSLANSWDALQTFSAGLTVSGGQLIIPSGTSTAPSLAFTGGVTGFYFRTSPSGIGFIVNGTPVGGSNSNNEIQVVSSATFSFSSSTTFGAVSDVKLRRLAAYSLGIDGGASGQVLGLKALTELTTIAAAATTDTAIQIPANAIVFAVSARVTTVIPTAATFTVKGTTSATQFDVAGGVSTAANTTDVGTALCPYKNGAAQTIRITPNLTPADNTGRVRVTIHFYEIVPATS